MGFTVYEHLAKSPPLQCALKASLPYSINLVYRTQHTNRTQDAHILCTFSPHTALDSIPQCWAAAYLDRSMRPETELWLFTAGEVPDHSPSNPDLCSTCKNAVLSLIDYMSTLPIPPLHPDNVPALEVAKLHERENPETGPGVRYYAGSAGTFMRHLLLPDVVLLGACHHQVVSLIKQMGLVREEFPGDDAELNKFLFKISELPKTRDLPNGLEWGNMRERDVPVVQSRTVIPRKRRTLMSLESVGVFEKERDKPVAWTFLGLDGSLTTLHTEPEYRGKGIAKAVAAKIMREYAPGLAVDEEGNAWAHGDVYVGNVQSESVCRSLGGKAMWKLFWLRIDLGRAGALEEGK